MEIGFVDFAIRDRVAYISIDRPEKRNALNQQVVQELSHQLDRALADEGVKVIVICATGTVFSAGADLGYLQKLQANTYEENLEDSRQLKDLFLKIYLSKKVIIAQVQGHAIAGGSGLISVCDYVFTVPDAKFGYTEVRIGFIPAIVMVFLIRKLGEQKARQLLLRGSIFSAKDALELGLVYKIVEPEELGQAVTSFAEELCRSNSAQSMMATKTMFADIMDMPLREALDYAITANAKTRESADCRKGIAAFLAKEKLTW